MQVLFASSEMFPYAKSGGLADVASSLPKSLSTLLDISTIMPLYGFMSREDLMLECSENISLNESLYTINFYKTIKDNLTTYFVEAPLLSDTQSLYGDSQGDYADNDLRFGIFCKAIVLLAKTLKVDVLHLNDWHTALCALYIKEENLNIKTVFTIHNLAYQGVFSADSLKRLSVDSKYFNADGLEFYSKINLLKAGVAYSDAVTTVSPTYAKEILTKEFGCGLEGFLEHHRGKLSGILNGIDMTQFNPKTDGHIYRKYDYNSLEKKEENKKYFIKNTSFKNLNFPLIAMVSRLVEQKGVELVIESLEELLNKEINLYIVGEGSSEFATRLSEMSNRYENLEFFNKYEEGFSHKVYSAADFLLMPSRFEPCGLSQMIAMSYGTLPIVHKVGGLKDSVIDEIDGIVFNKYTKEDLILAVDRAINLKKNSQKFNSMKISVMKKNLSFSKSALKYIEIYKKVLI